MFKLLNKKKNNKGFTLVELVIVIAILAILVGILAPQYTKYVEKSRKAADAANLENLVTAVKVAAADDAQDIVAAMDITYTIEITKDGTTVDQKTVATADKTNNIKAALNESAGTNWEKTTLKSKAWSTTTIKADLLIEKNGSVTVTYTPTNLKNEAKAD